MFKELVKTGIELNGRNRKYTWLPPTLRKYGEFVRWVQFKPYREALEQNLPKGIVNNFLLQCQTGKVTEKVVPDDWPEDKETGKYLKEPKEEDLVEKSFDIHLGSTIVTDNFFSAEGLAKLLQLGISIDHPEITEITLDQEIDNEEQNRVIVEMQKAMIGEIKEVGKNE